MAPTAAQVQRQTDDIVSCLFADEDDVDSRQLVGEVEADSVATEDEHFDPVAIAEKLRLVADALNDDARFKAALANLKQAAAQEAAEAAFSQGVEALSATQVAQRAEVAPEMSLIRASVALGLYIKKSCPELRGKARHAMAAFLNRRVGTWVAEQGGWDKVANL